MVWLADQVLLKRPVALKLLKQELDPSEELMARFLDEARITASLRHPNIVVIYDHGVEQGVAWIAYEYVPGATLSERLTEGPVPWREAVDTTAQIASALAHAHAHEVLHRDVKPSNVFLAAPGHYKLGDFGLARQTIGKALTQTGAIVGTPAYMPPEVIGGFSATPASDVYALGAVFFELLTGQRPFEQMKDVPLYTHHLKTPPPAPSKTMPGLPAMVDEVVIRAMAKAPKDRYPGAEEMRTALSSLLLSRSSTETAGRVHRGGDNEGKTGRKGGRSFVRVEHSRPGARPGRKFLFAEIAAVVLSAAVTAAWMVRSPAPKATIVPWAPEATTASLLTLVSTTPLPPRSARFEYTLRPAPSAPLAVEARIHGRTMARAHVEGSRGVATLLGLTPGHTYDVFLAGGPRVGTFEMPRFLPLWHDIQVADTCASVHAWALEAMALDVRVVRMSDGKVVFSSRHEGSHRISLSICGLTPDTHYTLRLRPLDRSLYLPPGSAERAFQTRDADYCRVVRKESRFLLSPDRADRCRAIGFIHEFPDPEMMTLGLKAMADPRNFTDDEVRARLVLLFGASREPRAMDALLRALEVARSPDERLNVVDEIRRLCDPRGFQPIVSLAARNLLPTTRFAQWRATLGSGFVYQPVSSTTLAAEIYAKALVACDPVRAKAHFLAVSKQKTGSCLLDRLGLAPAMSMLRVAELIPSAEAFALKDPTLFGRLTADNLADLDTDAARRALCRMLDSWRTPSSPEEAVTTALSALGRSGRREDIPAVVALASSGRALVRVRVAEALGQLGGSSAVRALVALLNDPDPKVRRMAACGLGHLKAPEAVDALLARLGDTQGSAGRIPRALGQIGDRRAADRLLGLARKEPASGQVLARLDRAEALWALGRLKVRTARPLIERALSRGDPYERYLAASALGWLGDPEAIPRLNESREPSGTSPFLQEATTRSIETLRDRRGPRGRMVIVDSSCRYVRSGILFTPGEDARIEVDGVTIEDTRSSTDGSIAPGLIKSCRQLLNGRIDPWGQGHPGLGELRECTRYGSGELLLSWKPKGDSSSAAGFATVWIDGGTPLE